MKVFKEPPITIYTCSSFEGHFPVGTAAIIKAKSKLEAAEILESELRKSGLPQSINSEMIEEFNIGSCKILCDGNY